MAYHSASYRSSAVTGNVLHYALAIQLNRFRMTLRSAAGVRPCTGRTPAVFSVPLTLRLLCCMACCQYGHFGACKLIAARWLSRRLSPTFGAAPQVTPPTSGAQLAFQRRSFSAHEYHVVLSSCTSYLIITHVATWPTRLLTPCSMHRNIKADSRGPQRVSAMPCDTGMPARFKPPRPEARCTALLWMAGHALCIRLARHNTPSPNPVYVLTSGCQFTVIPLYSTIYT